MSDYLASTVALLIQHPRWAWAAVFLINLSESLLVVGLFVPGTVVMFGIGALVAMGAMGLWATLGFAVAGALVGDGLSYLIGRRYREHLRDWWLCKRHPEWIARSERFFLRHGAKSVIFGRFIGPVRPIIPAVAGMMGMSPARFYLANFLSAVTWAPAYILPGVLLGASLTLASKVATRLTLIILLLLFVVWLTALLVRRTYALIQPHTQRIVIRFLSWGRVYPLFGEVTEGLLDPRHPELRSLVGLAAFLLLGGVIFFVVLLGEIGYPQPLSLDYRVYYLLQGLRTYWADQGMVFLSELGDAPVNIAVACTGLLWLGVRRYWLAAFHWAAAVAMAALVGLALNALLPNESPRPELYLAEMKDAFPSVHAAVVSTLYGFLAVLAAGGLSRDVRRLPYTIVAIWISLLALAHLYLGRHWLSDVLGGITLGIIWSGALGIAYRRRAADHLPLRLKGLWVALLFVLLFVGGGHLFLYHQAQLDRYEVRPPQGTLAMSSWWNNDWEILADYRVDWGGAEDVPMTIQIAGDLSELSHSLQRHGWCTPPLLDTTQFLRIFVPDAEIRDLPVLPYAHDGHAEALQLIRCAADVDVASVRLVLHLWRADAQLSPGNIPLWVGNITRQRLVKPLGLVTLPKTDPEYVTPLALLQSALEDMTWRKVSRMGPYPLGWDGTVLLLKASHSVP